MNLLDILVETKADNLRAIEQYFNDCMDEFYPEYRKYIDNGDFVYPGFIIKKMSGKVGLCRGYIKPLQGIWKVEIAIHSDYAGIPDVSRSIVYHETIHYIQFLLKDNNLEPYKNKSISHDSFFKSEMDRMNSKLGTDFVKQTEDTSDYQLEKDLFIYLVDYREAEPKGKYDYVAAFSRTENKVFERKRLDILKNFAGAKFYKFKTRNMAWMYTVLEATKGMSIFIPSDLKDNSDTAYNEFNEILSSGDTYLINTGVVDEEPFFVYGFIVVDKGSNPIKFTKINAVYSIKDKPGVYYDIKEKLTQYHGYGETWEVKDKDFYTYKIETGNAKLLTLQKYIRGKSFIYQVPSSSSEIIRNILDNGDGGIVHEFKKLN